MVMAGTSIAKGWMEKPKTMSRINIRKFGLATGMTGALLYAGCILLMATVGREGTIQFFNSLLHGLDVSSVIRMNVPVGESLLGVVQTFILAWLTGACVAGIYNFAMRKQ
jgi:hypothetical protein